MTAVANELEDDSAHLERRDERRHSLLVRATIINADAPISAYLVDIARTGMGLQAPIALTTGAVVVVQVTLECLAERRALRLQGVVVNCHAQTARHHRIGVRFTELDRPTRRFINRLCP